MKRSPVRSLFDDAVPPDHPSLSPYRGHSQPERLAVAAAADAVLADPTVTEDELYRVVRCSLYVLTPDELRRVGGLVVAALTGAAREAQA